MKLKIIATKVNLQYSDRYFVMVMLDYRLCQSVYGNNKYVINCNTSYNLSNYALYYISEDFLTFLFTIKLLIVQYKCQIARVPDWTILEMLQAHYIKFNNKYHTFFVVQEEV